MTQRRSVVEEHRFVEELAAIDDDVARTDEALFYVKEVLARDPYIGDPSSFNARIRRAPIILQLRESSNWRPASVYYVVREEAVHLVSIQLDDE